MPALRRGLSSPLTPMALPTALAMLALSAGLLAAERRGSPCSPAAAGPGGALLRRLAPAAVLVPVALAFATLEGLRNDWFDEREGLALLGAALIVAFAPAAGVHRRARSSGSVMREQAIIDATVDAVITLDAEGRVREFNAAAERMFGRRRDGRDRRGARAARGPRGAPRGAPARARAGGRARRVDGSSGARSS